MNTMNTMQKTGFTLIELLVVITIIIILGTITYLVINPFELIKRTNDTNRISSLATVNQAIAAASQAAGDAGSLQSLLCSSDWDGNQCVGKSNVGEINAVKKNNGTGWVKINVGSQNVISVPTLPLDPVNDVKYHYTYCSNGMAWELATALQSTKQADLASEDGGNDPLLYEIGSDLTLIAPNGSSCVY